MLRKALLPVARLIERGLERIGARPGDPVLEPYLGYATPDGWVLRGRVLTHLRRATPEPAQSRWVSFRQMVSLFLTDEVADVRVEAAGTTAQSDGEGYVTLTVPAELRVGDWHDVPVQIVGRPASTTAFPVRVPSPDAEVMIISDIDDTMIETGAHSLLRNLWTTFTGSALTREVHQDAARLMARLSPTGCNPVFYVSSSPWNLHNFLDGLFAQNDLPRGPMFLRDLGLSDTGAIGEGHLGHKGRAIDIILLTQSLPAILLGDSGQKDAKVYLEVVKRHPGRVLAVALREPAPGTGEDDRAALSEIGAHGVPAFHVASFDEIADRLVELAANTVTDHRDIA